MNTVWASRARMPIPGQLATSARETNTPGIRALSTMISKYEQWLATQISGRSRVRAPVLTTLMPSTAVIVRQKKLAYSR